MRVAAGIGLRLAGYGALVVALTWPLGANITTHLPNVAGPMMSDVYYVGWALAWQSHALTTSPLRFADANIYGGAPLALFYGTPGFGLLPAFAPTFLATGNPTTALNGTFLLNLALTATMLHLVARSWTRSEVAGSVAGTTFATSQAALAMCGFLPHYAALAPLPAIVWLLARPSFGWGVTFGLAALVALQSLTDLVYLAMPLAITLAILAGLLLIRPATRTKGWRILVALVLAGVALLPLYSAYLRVRLANPDWQTQSVWTAKLFGMVDPRTGLPTHGPLALDWITLFLVLIGVGAGLVGLVPVDPDRRRAWRHAGFWFVATWLLVWVIPLQYPAFRDFVLHDVVRDFGRLGFGALIAACLLAGLGFSGCVEVARRFVPVSFDRVVAPALAGLLIVLRIGRAPWLPGEYPIEAAPVPGPEAMILRAGSGPVLVLPVGNPRVESRAHAAAMYCSVAHWRTLLNGYSSYHPANFRERMELAQRLPNEAVLDTLRRDTKLTNIVVHAAGMPGLTTDAWRRAIEANRLSGVRIDYGDDDVLVLAIDSQGW
jgi:hypothetical protein